MKKKLAFTTDLPTCTYVYHAVIMGIICTQFEKYAPWFYSHFIQIFTGTSCGPFGFFDMVFKNYPFIEYQSIKNNTLLMMNANPKEFIKNALDEGWYVYTEIDEYYLSNKPAFNNYSFEHFNLIFGYDEEEQLYNIAGYLQSKNAVSSFSESKVKMEEVEKAFINAPKQETFLLKLNNFRTKFDYNLVVESLYDYVYSQNTSSRVRALEEFGKTKRTYGIKTMELLNIRLKEIIETGYDNRYHFDLRIFRLLWEHKKIMYDRFVYMNEIQAAKISEAILCDYKEVVDGYKVLFALAKKVYITKETDSMPKMIEKIENLITKEKEVLESVLTLFISNDNVENNFNLKIL